MNFQNKRSDSYNLEKNESKLKDINESTIEKPKDDYSKKADIKINPTVTFYQEDESSKIEDIRVVDTESDDLDEDKKTILLPHGKEDVNVNKSSKKKKVLIYLILFLALGSSFLFYMNSSKDKKVSQDNDKKSVSTPVAVKSIARSDFKVFEKTIGSISNLDINSVASEVSGLVKKVNVDIGDTVKAGSIIAVIDSDEARNNLVSQEAEIKRIEALLADSRKTQNRYRELIKDGFVSQAELDTLDTNIKSYQEQLVNAKAVLANSRIKLDKAIVKAPTSGVIQQRYIAAGTFVSVSTPIVDIVNNKNLMVIASLPESFSYRLKKNQEVTLKVTGTDIVISSKIKELKPVIDEQSRSISLIIDIPANNYNLKPGGTLEVYISMEDKKGSIIVPESSVILRIAGKVVYVLNENNTVTEVPVKTGAYQDGLVEILTGLKGNETVVVDGAGFLTDKAVVSVK